MAAVQIGAHGWARNSSRQIIVLSSGIKILALIDNIANVLRLYHSDAAPWTTWTEFTGTPPAGYYSVALCTDATNWYVSWYKSATELWYASAATTAYPTDVKIADWVQSGSIVGSPRISMCLDASKVPHMVYDDFQGGAYTLTYKNKVGGSWNAGVVVKGGDHVNGDITIDTTVSHSNRYNLPQIAYNDNTNQVAAAIGTSNNPTATAHFTKVVLGAADPCMPSIAIDINGVTNILATDGDRKPTCTFLAENGGWGTAGNWTTETVVDATTGYRGGSIAINGTTRYAFTSNTSTGKIYYSTSTAYAAWAVAIEIEAGAMYFVRARWQYTDNPSYSTYGMDYICGNDPLYWNKLTIAASGITAVMGVTTPSAVFGVTNPSAVFGVTP